MKSFSRNKLAIHISAMFIGGFGVGSAHAALEEVIVTAQKSDQNVMDVGASISAIPEKALEFRGLTGASSISQAIPNLVYGQVAGAAEITVRGIGLNVETGFAEPAVAVHIDGVYLGRTNAAALDFSDLAGVEVLRGPQGTLYGRNATGGAINFITRKPTEQFEAGLTAGVGSLDAVNVNGFISGPLSSNLQGRLFVDSKDQDGYVRNHTTGKTEGGTKALTYKGALSLQVTDDLTADLSYLQQHRDLVGPSFEQIVGILPGVPDDPRPNNIRNDLTPNSDINMQVGSLTIDWQGDAVGVKSITGFTKFDRKDEIDGDATALSILVSGRDENANTLSQEFNVSGHYKETLDWILGAFAYQESSTGRTDVFIGSTGTAFFGPFSELTVNKLREQVLALGYFGDGTVNFTDTLRAKVGFRYSEEKKDGNQTVTFFDDAATLCSGQKSNISFYDFSPKAGMEWNPSSDLLTYVQYQKGFKSGGFNQAGCGSFQPEEIDSYEVGAKGKFLDNRLQASVSAFHYAYDNLQVLQIRNNTGFVENAASSTINGAELETKFALTDSLQVDFNASWLDATYDKFVDGSGNDYSGNTLSRSPKYTLFGGLEYTLPLEMGPLGELRLRGEVYHSDKVFYRPSNTKDDAQDSYDVVNLFATLSSTDGKYQLRAFLKNATDEEYLQNVIALSFGLDGHYAAPRTWGLEASMKWF